MGALLSRSAHGFCNTVNVTHQPATRPSAIKRMAVADGQKNVLLRVDVTFFGKNINRQECNAYRDAIYAAFHLGAAWEWTARGNSL
jgi:hypothetical protein